MLLNINVPFLPLAECKGVRITRLGTRASTRTRWVRNVDPRGRDYFWIGGEDPVWRPDEGTDFHSVDAGYVSITPLQLELTDQVLRADMMSWG